MRMRIGFMALAVVGIVVVGVGAALTDALGARILLQARLGDAGL